MTDKITILVADDEPTARMLMAAALQKAGFDVVLAVDGEDALRKFAEHPCDMAMLDVDMPGLDGYQTCAVLRQRVGGELPIVLVTAMDDTQSIEQAYECGATDFIAKPINWTLIGHRVKYLLRAYQIAMDLRGAKERNAAVLKAVPDLLFEIDLEGRYIECHTPQSELLAAPAETLIGKTVSDILPADAAEVCMAALHEADEKGFSTGSQLEIPLPKGSFWIEL